jgi:hypothetical protein
MAQQHYPLPVMVSVGEGISDCDGCGIAYPSSCGTEKRDHVKHSVKTGALEGDTCTGCML